MCDNVTVYLPIFRLFDIWVLFFFFFFLTLQTIIPYGISAAILLRTLVDFITDNI